MKNSDYKEILNSAKSKLLQNQETLNNISKLKEKKLQLEKDLFNEEKALKDKIDININQRIEEISKSYDEEISKLNTKLKEKTLKKDKARKLGEKERIEAETLSSKNKIKELKDALTKGFKENKLPAFAKTNLYYAIFMPKGFLEHCRLILLTVLFFGVIPMGLYKFLKTPKEDIFRVAICIGVIFVFGFIYALFAKVRLKNYSKLEEFRAIKDEIKKHKKDVKAISKGIKADKDDSKYNLSNFEYEISYIEKDINSYEEKKKTALEEFEAGTKNKIIEEITLSVNDKIDEFKKEIDIVEKELVESEKKEKEQKISLINNYESYLGKDYLDINKIDSLIQFMEQENLTNISDAILRHKNLK